MRLIRNNERVYTCTPKSVLKFQEGQEYFSAEATDTQYLVDLPDGTRLWVGKRYFTEIASAEELAAKRQAEEEEFDAFCQSVSNFWPAVGKASLSLAVAITLLSLVYFRDFGSLPLSDVAILLLLGAAAELLLRYGQAAISLPFLSKEK